MKTRVHSYYQKTCKQDLYYADSLLIRLRSAYVKSGSCNKWMASGYSRRLRFDNWVATLTNHPQDLDTEFNSHEVIELLTEE